MMSKKIFSVQDWENVHSEQRVPAHDEGKHSSCAHLHNNVEEDVESVVSAVEAHGIDVAPRYAEWVNLGFALADACGEGGRGYFHRLSSLHHDYNQVATDKQYSYCLRGKRQGITIATLFYMAEQHGVVWRKRLSPISPNTQNGETDKRILGDNALPSFPEEVFDGLPTLLKEAVDNAVSKDDRGTILIGSIVTLSVCFYNLCGVYDERIVYPNLYLFVTAEAGMGKGALSLCRELVVPINRELHELTNRLKAQYKAEMAEYVKGKKSGGMDMPQEPPLRTLIVPANSSASAFLRIAKDNDGIILLFETEGDTLSQTLKSDYGNYSDVLRKAFHHEVLSMSRCKDREMSEVEQPRISVVLAGTPGQVNRLISNEEDGLLSRFCFYALPFKRGIRNVFATSDVAQSKNAKFKLLGERFYHLHQTFMRQGSYTFCLPQHLQTRFVSFLRKANEECCDEVDNNMQGIVRRMGLIAFRMMMVLTALRTMEAEMHHLSPAQDETIHLLCQDCDYQTAMFICQTLLRHSVYVYRRLSNVQGKTTGEQQDRGAAARRNAFFNLLPVSFTKKDYDALIETTHENRSTASKWIDLFIREQRLHRTGQGMYQKTEL